MYSFVMIFYRWYFIYSCTPFFFIFWLNSVTAFYYGIKFLAVVERHVIIVDSIGARYMHKLIVSYNGCMHPLVQHECLYCPALYTLGCSNLHKFNES
jgi:hypothetical protein